jgi:two-component system cell cycle sensor histidine kinase/response regulator CckA
MLYGARRLNKGRRHEIYEALESRGFHFGLATGRRKDGSTLPLEIISGDIKGRSGAVLLIRDITERNEVEERQRRVEERAFRSQNLESLGLLAGGIAHDFNNLLMIVQGHSDLITMQASKDAALKESIAEIRKSTNRGRDFFRHLLSFAGRAPGEVQPVNLSEIMRYTDRMLLVRLPRNVTVVDRLSDDMPMVNGDDSQLHQVAMNLMVNALEAIGDEEGTITTSSGVRDCSEEEFVDSTAAGDIKSGRFAFFSVADTGCGMDEDTQRKLWAPFYTTKQEGTGMGLAAVLGIVHSHGGVIKVESEPGSGTTMTVLFPVE